MSAKLPPLPPVIRYFDDFYNEMRSIRDISSSGKISILVDGLERFIDFDAFGVLDIVMKHVVVDWFQRLDPTTVIMKVANVLRYIARCGLEPVAYLFVSSPFDSRAYWSTQVLSDVKADESWALRAALHSLCRLNIGHWSPLSTSIIRGLKKPEGRQVPRRSRWRLFPAS